MEKVDNYAIIENYLMIKMPDEVDHHKAADICLSARTDMASFVDSLVAPLSLVNALLVALAMKKRDDLSRHFEKLEGIWDAYSIYTKRENQ